MRSPIGPFLVVLGLASTLIGVLLLFQTLGLRSDIGRAEERVATLQAEVEAREAGVTAAELRQELDAIEAQIEELASDPGGGGDVGNPAGGDGVSYDDLVDRLDTVLARINDLDERVDEICDSVPVC